jgi:hypothetical protein
VDLDEGGSGRSLFQDKYPGICLEVLRNATKLSVGMICASSRDSNWTPPGYKTES